MQISIPLTGNLISYKPVLGDPNDPVRPIDLDLGNVSWQLISLDLENDLTLIEVTPAEEGDFETGKFDKDKNPIYERRGLSGKEKQKLLDNVKTILLDNPISDLYAICKSPRLRKPQISPKSNGSEM
jgi:hypothetical protein